MAAAGRSSHLVGSIPAPDARAAMELALARLAPSLDMLPDGETGERFHWVVHIIEGMRQHPDLELKKDGDWSDYDQTPVFKVKRGHRLRGETLDFGHVQAFRESYPVFGEIAAEHALDGVPFQVGIPGDFDMALFVLGPLGAFRNRRPFTEATLREIREIHAIADGKVVFQIEVPAELVFVARMPGPLQPLMARYLARIITTLPQRSPDGTRFGIHLCLGDMNHRALAQMKDTRPVVQLANAIAGRWPDGRTLEFVHAPFAAASEPPPRDAAWYRPLEDLRLSESTRFIAGFAHEDQDIAVQRELQQVIERAVRTPVDVATTCGLGRREPEAAEAALRRVAELITTGTPRNHRIGEGG